MRTFQERGLSGDLPAPFRASALPIEYSQTQIRSGARNVFDIKWDRAGSFKAIHFGPCEWERVRIGLPEPIPF